jgi:Tfp pilus assembly protein PilF
MNLRPKTVRRLTILLAGFAVLVAIGFALYLRNEHRKAEKLADARRSGLAAFHAGDFRATLDALGPYVARNKQDPEALLAYGTARSRIEEPNGKHIIEGIAVFNALLSIDPTNTEARHRLLDLYTQAYYSREAIDLADRVLATDPTDAAALRAKCVGLDRLRKFDEALSVSQRLNDLDPSNLEQQLVTYELMRKLKHTPAELLARATTQQAAHPQDPRFKLLLAMAYGNAGDGAKGKQWLRAAATQPAPDATFVRQMVRVLDSLKMYAESRAMLDRAVERDPTPGVMRVLIQRLWQNDKLTEVIDRLKKLDARSADSDTALLAYKALALYETGKVDDANHIILALSARTSDQQAVAWSMALSARLSGAGPRAALRQYESAIVRDPSNPVIRFMVGEAYAKLGEPELAIAAWKRSAELSPSWASPHVNIARTLAASGRYKEAVAEAQLAVRGAPDQLFPAITLATIEFQQLEQDKASVADQAPLLALTAEIQKVSPGEPQTLPLYVTLLARAGRREDAIAAVRASLNAEKTLDPQTIQRLMTVSREQKLGLEPQLSAASAAAPAAPTPHSALVQAAELAKAGKPQEGLALLQTQSKAATTQPVQWQLALVQYREAIGDPSAAGDWVALGDAHPDDLSVQSSILKSGASARADRAFIARTIDRLKALTGPEGQTWKIERARWLIGGDGGDDENDGENREKDSAEAVNTLNDIIRVSPKLTEPRVLLAVAYDHVGNTAAAIKELQTAADLEPHNAAIALELCRLLQSQGRFGEARGLLEKVIDGPELSPEIRRRAAAMLAQQGDLARAARTLESAPAESPLDNTTQLLLAQIYQRQGRAADAELIYSQLLAGKPLDARTIRAAVEYFASKPDLQHARQILARLSEVNESSAAREITLGWFEERFGTRDAAARHYRAATQPTADAADRSAPQRPPTPASRQVASTDGSTSQPSASAREHLFSSTAPASPPAEPWRQLIAFQLRSGNYADAARDADAALALRPDGSAIKRLKSTAFALNRLLKQEPSLAPMLATLAGAADDPGVAEFLSGAVISSPDSAGTNSLAPDSNTAHSIPPVSGAPTSGATHSGATASDNALLDQLRYATKHHPRSLALQSALIQWLVSTQAFDEAVQVASATLELFPNSADAARVAYGVYRAAGNWDLAAVAAQKWRERSLEHPMPADWALAEAKLALSDGSAAVKLLAPYVESAGADPDHNAALLTTCLRAFAAAGDATSAQKLAAPLLPKSRAWRAVWLDLASAKLKDPAIASRWIHQVESLVPAEDDGSEHFAVANAWYTLGIRLRVPEAFVSAEKALDSVIAAAHPAPEALVLRAAIAERRGDDVAAEAFYRKALAGNPRLPDALNNLAYLILLRKGDLGEARMLIDQAIKLSSRVASFYDTRARIQARSGEAAAALSSFRHALDLEPNNLEALIGMAAMLNTTGKRADAAALLAQIDNLLKTDPPLSDSVRQELQDVRSSLRASS